ncbi:MAG: lipopolysaccharide biosynthesis protein, partial [Flavobacteriales bacterium]
PPSGRRLRMIRSPLRNASPVIAKLLCRTGRTAGDRRRSAPPWAAAAGGGLALARTPGRTSDAWAAIAGLLRQGLPAQAANGLQLLNYRLSYYLVERFRGASALGLWSIANQLAEGSWLAPKSLGAVLYARVSNLAERDRQREAALAALKASVALAALAALLLVALPEALFQWAFGAEARGIRGLVLVLLPGLLAMAASQALSHYLSGTGRVAHNTLASGIGVAATLALGAWLIPHNGAWGAAVTASAAYTASACYQAIVFNRLTGARLAHYLPSGADAGRLLALLRRLLGR